MSDSRTTANQQPGLTSNTWIYIFIMVSCNIYHAWHFILHYIWDFFLFSTFNWKYDFFKYNVTCKSSKKKGENFIIERLWCLWCSIFTRYNVLVRNTGTHHWTEPEEQVSVNSQVEDSQGLTPNISVHPAKKLHNREAKTQGAPGKSRNKAQWEHATNWQTPGEDQVKPISQQGGGMQHRCFYCFE